MNVVVCVDVGINSIFSRYNKNVFMFFNDFLKYLMMVFLDII